MEDLAGSLAFDGCEEMKRAGPAGPVDHRRDPPPIDPRERGGAEGRGVADAKVEITAPAALTGPIIGVVRRIAGHEVWTGHEVSTVAFAADPINREVLRARRGWPRSWSRSWPNLEFSGTSDLVLDGDRMLHAQIDFVGTIDADGGPGELLIPSAGNQDVMLQRLRPSDGAW